MCPTLNPCAAKCEGDRADVKKACHPGGGAPSLRRMATGTRIGVTTTQKLRLTVSLQTSLWVLKADAMGLARYLEEQAAEIPALVLGVAPVATGDWLPRWSGVLPWVGGGHPETDTAAPEPSLIAHVLGAISGLVPPADRHIALALAETLEPSGWLGRDPDRVAADLGVTVPAVEAVLALMQKIEPAGLFAQGLADCLRLQAEDAGCLDGVMRVMLLRLDLVASGDWGALARLAQTDESTVMAHFRTIRSFNPKPGAAFAALASPVREPDLVVRQGADGWEVSLNRSSLPALSVQAGAKGGGRAREVLALVENRNTTLLAVGRAILVHQRAALDAGPGALRPLTMQAVAEAVSLHKSTVSRVVAGTAVDTPHGTWWLRALFSGDMGGDIGGAGVRARLARLIAGEDRTAPLSDEMLAAVLSAGGLAIARRTVAKYRAVLRIPAAHRRRVRGHADT
jgi:RNA polymerase sigma-54 factor